MLISLSMFHPLLSYAVLWDQSLKRKKTGAWGDAAVTSWIGQLRIDDISQMGLALSSFRYLFIIRMILRDTTGK